MGQSEDLNKNIDDLTAAILKLNEDSPPFDIAKYFMTPRQIAKKMMQVSSQVQTNSANTQIPVDEKSVHIVIYGKYMMGADGKVVDNEIKFPECVDHDRAMSLTHPTLKEKIPKMKKDIKNSIDMLKIKEVKLKDAVKLAGKQIITGISAFAAAAITIPIGSGVPTAMAALQSIVAAIATLAGSVMEIIPILGPLVDIPLLIAEAVLSIVFGVVNTILVAMIVVITLIAGIKKLVQPIVKLIGG